MRTALIGTAVGHRNIDSLTSQSTSSQQSSCQADDGRGRIEGQLLRYILLTLGTDMELDYSRYQHNTMQACRWRMMRTELIHEIDPYQRITVVVDIKPSVNLYSLQPRVVPMQSSSAPCSPMPCNIPYSL